MTDSNVNMDWTPTISNEDVARVQQKLNDAKTDKEKTFWKNLLLEVIMLMQK
jgi:hypothetical protein